MSNQKIKRLFIANRGEIARRIAYSAKISGIETVCLTSNPPPNYLIDCVDHFIFVEHETTQLYLDPDLMIKQALSSACNAIHPGFGFLSENAVFAQKVIDSNLIWIGPSAKVIDQMGDKSQARTIAEKVGIPCLQGLSQFKPNSPKSEKILDSFLEKAEFPLLIKAAFGGGGKGMRLIHKTAEAEEAIKRAASEALNAFSNDTLIIEQYLENARHIEVQILADSYGNIKILGDRDCSSQRRHQKIIEEAPAPNLTEKLREDLYRAAYTLAKEVKYCSCGTIEFLVCTDKKNQLQKFYFLEMNTRLQVEHTVTEEIFGIDLVSWQFRVANNEKLSKECLDLQPRGHSIEARVYAEDPENNFIPSATNVYGFFPYQTQNIRWEIGLDEQDIISNHFDPMIAKVISKADTREQARALLQSTLEKTFIGTTKNNREFLCTLLDSDAFKSSQIDTNFIQKNIDSILKELTNKKQNNWSLIKDKIHSIKDLFLSHHKEEPKITVKSLSSTIFAKQNINTKHNIISHSTKNQFLQLQSYTILHPHLKHLDLKVKKIFFHDLNKKNQLSTVVQYRDKKGTHYFILYNGSLFLEENKVKIWSQKDTTSSSQNHITAPVPGKIIKISVQEKQEVKAKQDCFILESMKMEFPVKVETNSRIEKILIKEGEQVNSGQKLATLVKK